MATKPQVVEPIVPNSGPTGGNFDQVKNEILEQLRQEIKGKGVESPRRFESPYSKEILVAPLPKTFKMPNLVIYDGKGDPNNHIDIFKSWMDFEQVSELARCRAFPLTLAGPAQAWHSRIPPKSIFSFEQLAFQFVTHFNGAKPMKKPATHLMSVRQGDNEPLEDYTRRFNQEAMQVEDFTDQAAIQAILAGLRPGAFRWDIAKNTPKTLSGVIEEAQKHVIAEGLTFTDESRYQDPPEKEEPKLREDGAPNSDRRKAKSETPPPPHLRRSRFDRYTPLTIPRRDILHQIQGQNVLKRPEPLKTPFGRKNKNKYCRYHRDYGHDTEDCFELKEEIEALIRRGQLRHFVAGPNAPIAEPQRRSNDQAPPPPNPPPVQEIRTIIGGSSYVGNSNRARKIYARQARPEDGQGEVFHMSYEAGATLAEEMSTITFTEEEARRVCQPHDDALVVTLRVGHNNVHRILIDGGSSVDVMCKSTFQKMELTIDMLKPSPTPLYGFAGKKVIPEGSIELPISIGQTEHQKALMVRFLVVDTPSVYNIILGRPTLNALKAVVSTYHLLMKFPVAGGVGELGEISMRRENAWQ